MPLFDYPSCPGSWQASAKFRFADAPPSWVGPLRQTAHLATLEEALCGEKLMNSGRIRTTALAASVTVALGAAGVRHSITGLKTYVTGGYPSCKIGRPVEHESMNEYAFMQYNEVDPGVIDYRTQPMLFEFMRDGERVRYFADGVRLLANGRIQVVELKTSAADVRKPAYKSKLEAVSAICKELGWQFMLVEGGMLRASNVFSHNVNEIQSRRFAVTPEALKVRLARRFHTANDSIAVAEIIDLCGGGTSGLSAMCALMVQRIIHTDLRYQINENTLVHAMLQNEVAL